MSKSKNQKLTIDIEWSDKFSPMEMPIRGSTYVQTHDPINPNPHISNPSSEQYQYVETDKIPMTPPHNQPTDSEIDDVIKDMIVSLLVDAWSRNITGEVSDEYVQFCEQIARQNGIDPIEVGEVIRERGEPQDNI